MAKLPALQFYPGDWKKDVGVQALDLHDRGLWFEMLLLMHDSEQRGKLVLNGRPMPRAAIARAIGIDVSLFEIRLTLLLELGVASIEQGTDIIYSRRMVKDENARRAHTEAGKKGGNPALLNRPPTPGVIQTPNQIPTPSFSLSLTEPKKDIRRFTSAHVDAIYLAYPKKAEPRAAKKAIENALLRLEGQSPGDDLLCVVREYAASPEGSQSERDLLKNPATWFNKGCYQESWKDWQTPRRKR